MNPLKDPSPPAPIHPPSPVRAAAPAPSGLHPSTPAHHRGHRPPDSPDGLVLASAPSSPDSRPSPPAQRPAHRPPVPPVPPVRPALAALGLAALLLTAAPASAGTPDPGAADPPPAGEQTVERRIERQVIRTGDGESHVFELRREGGDETRTLFVVGPDGEPVRMEVEADGEGGFHWVERDSEGEVVRVRELDEIAEAGEPRVRAVFIGKEAPPIAVGCGGEGEEACPPGFRFGYDLLDPEGLGARRGYLGAALTELTPELRAHFGAPEEAGVLVARVEPDSPAAAAGVAVGDVITAVDGEPLATSFDLRRRIRELEAGQRTTLEVVRGGRVLALPVTIAEREVPEVDVRRFLWHAPPGVHHLPGGPGESGTPGAAEPFVYRLDPEAMNDTMVELRERFASPELRRHVIHLRGAEDELEKRIAELEKRIAELEAALDAGAAPPGD